MVASKLQFAIARSVKYGWLDSEEWLIEVKGMGKTAATALKDCIQLINGFDNLYGTSISPQSVRVITEEGPFVVSLNKEAILQINHGYSALFIDGNQCMVEGIFSKMQL